MPKPYWLGLWRARRTPRSACWNLRASGLEMGEITLLHGDELVGIGLEGVHGVIGTDGEFELV